MTRNTARDAFTRRITPLLAGAGALALFVSTPARAGEAASMNGLTLTPATLPTPADGHNLTLTVNGVERDLAPGHYAGNVVLTTTDDIPVQYHQLPVHHFRAALYVADGAPVEAKSVAAANVGAHFAPGMVSDLHITSVGERFNGIIVTGMGKYVINHPVMNLTGNGGNDFAGFGAAIMATGNADVWVNHPIIHTHGAIRTALFTGGHATMHIDGAEIETRNGTLPADYKFTVEVGRMMEVPWMLGLSGNVRTSNLVDFGTLYLSHSHVRTQGWGAMSTDDNTRVRMFVSDSLIETVDSGYGCYSIGDSIDTFDHSVLKVADIGCIMAAEGSVTFTKGTVVQSRRYGVMMHSGAGGGTLTIDKGSALHAAQTAIEVKGIGTTVLVDHATVTSGNHTILQAMENDDPFMKAMASGHMPPGMGGPPPGMAPDGDHPGPKRQEFSHDVVGTFRSTHLVGDFWNGRTAQGAMTLTFEDASVTGVISTSTVRPASGKEPVRATYREIGHVVNTPAPTTTANGLSLTLGAKSRWVVTGKSYLTGLTLAPGAVISAPEGRPARITVDGKRVRRHAGQFVGAIVVTP